MFLLQDHTPLLSSGHLETVGRGVHGPVQHAQGAGTEPLSWTARLAQLWRWWLRAFALSLWGAGMLVGMVPLAVAQQVIPSSVETPSTALIGALVLIDSSGKLSIDDVAEQFRIGKGQRVVTEQIMPMSGGSAVWYQLTLPPVLALRDRVLTVPHPGLDTADLFSRQSLASGEANWRVQRSGDTRPVAQWPISNLYPAFEVPAEIGTALPLYLRVTNIYPVSVSWNMLNAGDFQSHIKHWYLLLGVFVGLVLVIVAISFIQATTWHEPIHFFFAIYVAVAALTQLALTGLGGEYFWPHYGWWNDRSLSTLAIASGALLHLFFRQLLAQRDMPLLSAWLLVMAVLGAVGLVASLAPNRAPFMPLFALYYTLGLLTYLGTAAWYTTRRPNVGVWMLAAMACLAGGGLFPILRLLEVVPSTLATQYGAQAGAALQIPLLMVGLYLRSRQKRANQARVGALPRVDPLTGLASHRVLLQRLDSLLERQQRSNAAGAVMRIRITNIAALRKDHGLEAVQTAMVQAGALAMSIAREGDTVARHREGDFVLVVSRTVSRQWLADNGQKLIAHGLTGLQSLPAHSSLHFNIAVAMAPFSAPDATALLQTLNALLEELSLRSGTALRFVGNGELVKPAVAPARV